MNPSLIIKIQKNKLIRTFTHLCHRITVKQQIINPILQAPFISLRLHVRTGMVSSTKEYLFPRAVFQK